VCPTNGGASLWFGGRSKSKCIRKSRLGLRAARGGHTPLIPSWHILAVDSPEMTSDGANSRISQTDLCSLTSPRNSKRVPSTLPTALFPLSLLLFSSVSLCFSSLFRRLSISQRGGFRDYFRSQDCCCNRFWIRSRKASILCFFWIQKL